MSYTQLCHAIKACGGDYTSVTHRVLFKLLKKLRGVATYMSFDHKKLPYFQDWRKGKTGEWVTVVRAGGRGHCVILKDGKAFDNGFLGFFMLDDLPQVKIYSAYQLQEAA